MKEKEPGHLWEEPPANGCPGSDPVPNPVVTYFERGSEETTPTSESLDMTGPAPAQQVHPVLRFENLLMQILTWLLTAVFALIFIFVVTLVVMRYGFNTTIVGGSEATVVLFIYTTALGAAVDIARGKHIRIDALINTLPPRIRNWLEGINLVLIAGLHGALFYYSTQWISIVGNSEDPVLHVAEGFFEIAIPIGCIFAIVFCITRLISRILTPAIDPSLET